VPRFVIDNEIVVDKLTGKQVLHLEVDGPEHIVALLNEVAGDATTVDSAVCTCGHHASVHAVDDEERRQCIHCDCAQFECSVDHDATSEPCPARVPPSLGDTTEPKGR
jgi:hypothetical protein